MPDTFFRTIIYGAAAVALGAGAFIVTANKSASGPKGENLSAPTSSNTAVQQYDDAFIAPASFSTDSSALKPADAFASGDQRGSPLSVEQTPSARLGVAEVNPLAAADPVASPLMIHIEKDAIELTIPVDPHSGQSAQIPVALALAANAADLPPQLQEAAQAMALDFIENVADAGAAAQSAQNEAYYRRWQDAAFLSDRDFRMRYGRVAYVQMNQRLGQEAAADFR